MDGKFGALRSVGRMTNSSQNFVAEHNGGTVVFNNRNTQPADERLDYRFNHSFYDQYAFSLSEFDEVIAAGYVKNYYRILHGNAIRHDLSSFYQEDSVLTIEGERIQGSQNIVAKLTSLPFQQFYRSITSIDCQPCGFNGSMLVFVSGELQHVGGHQAHKFSQMFHLMPTQQGSYYVLNDIFRFNNG